MKSGSATYWLPITVDSIDRIPKQYEGYQGNAHPGIDEWVTEGLDYFTDIYGSVVDAHYITETVSNNSEGNYDFITMIVVTGMTDSEGDFEETIHEHWPVDLIEQLTQATERASMDGIVGYDLNPIRPDPVWSKFNR